MITAVSLYKSFKQAVSPSENGGVTIEQFNEYGNLGSLNLLNWLTGGLTGEKPPVPYTTQKIKEFLQHLIKSYVAVPVNGKIKKPEDYYRFEDLFKVGHESEDVCNDEYTGADTPIALMDSQEFKDRIVSPLEEIRLSFESPGAKLEGDEFEFYPRNLGTVKLVYLKMPVSGVVVPKDDTLYNDVIPDEPLSTSYEWPEYLREQLLSFVIDAYSTANRESWLAQKGEAAAEKTFR